MLQTHHLLSLNFPFTVSHHPQKLNFLQKPTISLSAFPLRRPLIEPYCLAQAQEPTTNITAPTTSEEGPVELPQSIFATTDEPSSLQVATSVLLTGAISVFLFRALRRRAKRAKELVSVCYFSNFLILSVCLVYLLLYSFNIQCDELG